MDKKCIMLYLDTLPQWKMMSREQAGELIIALLEYAESGKPLESEDPLVKMAFAFISAQVDRADENYKKKCERNKKVAETRWNKKETTDSTAECKEEPDNTTEYQEVPESTTEYQEVPENTTEYQSVPESTKKCLPNPNPNPNPKPNPNPNNISFLAASGEKNKKFVAPGVEDVEKFVQENGFCVDARKFHAHYTAHGWRDRNGIPLSDWKGMVQVWHINAQNGLVPQRKNNGDAGTSCAAGTASFDISDFEKLANRF